MTVQHEYEAVAASAAPESPPGPRGRWIGLGAAVVAGILVGYAAMTPVEQANWDLGQWWRTLVIALAVGVVVFASPSTRGRRGLSAWWFAPLVLIVAVVTMQSAVFGLSVDDPLGKATLMVAGVFGPVLATGGWLTLRGRAGVTYLCILVPFALSLAVTFALPQAMYAVLLPGNYFDMAPSMTVPFAAITLLTVTAGAWLAALPVFRRAKTTRQARITQRATAEAMATASTSQGASSTVPTPGSSVGTNPFAITALILGLTGTSIIAIVIGHIAWHQIRRTGQGGRGMALAGLILGYLELAAAIAFAIFWIALIQTAN